MKKYVTPYGTLIVIKDSYLLEKTYSSLESLFMKQDSLFKKVEDIGFEVKDYKIFIGNKDGEIKKYSLHLDLDFIIL